MKRKMNAPGRSNVFFIETIICLLFFIISSAVIMKVFASASKKSSESRELENVITCSQSIADVYASTGSLGEAAKLVFDRPFSNENRFVLDSSCRYDENGNVILVAEEISDEFESGTLKKLKLSFYREDKEIYTLDCSAYVGGT